MAAYLEAYAGRWDLPVRLGVRVEHLTRTSGDRFVVTADAGTIRTDPGSSGTGPSS